MFLIIILGFIKGSEKGKLAWALFKFWFIGVYGWILLFWNITIGSLISLLQNGLGVNIFFSSSCIGILVFCLLIILFSSSWIGILVFCLLIMSELICSPTIYFENYYYIYLDLYFEYVGYWYFDYF